MQALTVVQPFGDYQRGHQITDAAKIAKILDSPQSGHVVKVELPDAPPEQGDHE